MPDVADPDVEYRRLLEQCETQASADFDKTTVALSGGALGISIAFLKDVVSQPQAWTVAWLLAPAWLALVISVLCILLSLMFSMKSMRYQLECHLGRRKKRHPDELAGGRWRSRTAHANHVALGACVLGIALLAAFVTVNTWSKANGQIAAPKSTSAATTGIATH